MCTRQCGHHPRPARRDAAGAGARSWRRPRRRRETSWPGWPDETVSLDRRRRPPQGGLLW